MPTVARLSKPEHLIPLSPKNRLCGRFSRDFTHANADLLFAALVGEYRARLLPRTVPASERASISNPTRTIGVNAATSAQMLAVGSCRREHLDLPRHVFSADLGDGCVRSLRSRIEDDQNAFNRGPYRR